MSIPPSDAGYPYQPLEYAAPKSGRPGILTAVGIISIIVGAMSVLGSLAGVFSGFMYLRMSSMTFPAPATAPQAATTMPGITSTTAAPTTATTSTNFQYTTVAVGGNTATVTGSGAAVPFSFHVASGASELSIAEAGLSFCVAILLIIAGSLMLRDSPMAWRLHRIYLMLKVPLILVAAFASWWTYTSLMSGLSTLTTAGGGAVSMSGFNNMAAIFQAIIWAGISMIYPVALMIVLATRTSKEHLARLRIGVTG
jgi:hypothetical protein